MFRFFRYIREMLIQKGKIRQYLFYAIGEVFLVVVGILIALQINNWNEDRKSGSLRDQYISSLISDLKKDSVQLNDEIAYIQQDLQEIESFSKRLSSPLATFDTVRKIARHEFKPFFNPSNELNRNTITALISTGDLNLFNVTLRDFITRHNSVQLQYIKITDKNVDINLSKTDLLLLESTSSIKGPLLDKIWSDMKNEDLLLTLNRNMTHKEIMQQIITSEKKYLQDKTLSLLNQLYSYQK